MTAPAFSATYSDFKLVKTRGVVQVIFEVPLSESNAVLQILGGMPDVAAEKWFGIAPLDPKLIERKVIAPVEAEDEAVSRNPRIETAPAADPPTPRAQPTTVRSWTRVSLANQAGIRCSEVPFRRFLAEYLDYQGIAVLDADMAADGVRAHCGVSSRREIRRSEWSGDKWMELESAYRSWKLTASVVPA